MPSSDFDRDLRSVQEARALARAAGVAQQELESFDQERVDAVVEAMAAAGLRESERLAEMACRETGFGNVADKKTKNDFVLRDVTEAIRTMRTVGVIREDADGDVVEIAEPVGTVAAIIPSTNPTSTAMFKCLIALKARCAVVLAPHPTARACVKAAADVMTEAAVAAGAPRGIIGCMTVVTLEGTEELMRCDGTDVILATGGMGMVRAAYSSGKPAYGVGPGNVPAYVERSADVTGAVRDIFAGTTFDFGTLCSSEQSIICDRAIREEVLAEIEAQDGHVLDSSECEILGRQLITDEFLVDPRFVGRSAMEIAESVGIDVPDGTRVLVCPLDGVGRAHPLSHEKLSPVLAFYVVEDWREGCERCKELLRLGGMGHTLSIHSRDEDVVLEFGLHKPAHRILVNTVSALGAVGLTTGLFPSMTLGCGAWGNNITSDNIGPQHLLNVKRLARGIRPYRAADVEIPSAGRRDVAPGHRRSGSPPAIDTTDANDGLVGKIEKFLVDRGIVGAPSGRRFPNAEADRPARTGAAHAPASPASARAADSAAMPGVAEFVGEAEVRLAIARGQTILVGPDTIVTPLARDLGREKGVLRNR
jgi:acetaldehyde dehydrogenase (acetylating)